MTHYVYKLTDLITGEYYIGSRSCQGPAEEDRTYRGSMQTWSLSEEQKLYLDKTILKTFSNRDDAYNYERELILENKKDPLNRNVNIPGKVYKIDGVKVTPYKREKIKEEIQELFTGKPKWGRLTNE
jgi:hypothetical protein